MEENVVQTIDLSNKNAKDDLEGQSLTFFIGDTMYGLPLTNVVEIIDVYPITSVPGTPAYVKGVINLRGSILPLVDIRLKFGQPEREYDDQTNIIVTVLDDVSLGMVVDRVANVVRAEAVNNTSALPEFSTVNSNKYMTSVSRVGSQLVMNLNCETIMEDDNILNLG